MVSSNKGLSISELKQVAMIEVENVMKESTLAHHVVSRFRFHNHHLHYIHFIFRS